MHVLVIGGGIGGLCAARAVNLAGHRATVLERAEPTRDRGAGLLLWSNAVRALDALGFGDVRDVAAVARRLTLRNRGGRTLSVTDVAGLAERAGTPMLVVERPVLLERLADGADVRFGAPVAEVDGGGVVLEDGERIAADLVIAADGINSVARRFVCPGVDAIDTGFTVVRGLAEFDIGEGEAYEIWGAGELVGGVGLPGGRSYWFHEARSASIDVQDPVAAVRRAGWAAPTPQLVDATPPDAVLVHRIRRLAPLTAWTRGAVGLLGDAAHAMEPNAGQGAAQAIEDAEALLAALHASHAPLRVLAAYEHERRGRAAFLQRESTRIARVALSRHAAPRDLVTRAIPAAVRAHMMRRLMRHGAPARLIDAASSPPRSARRGSAGQPR